jgi:hypothetical protein
MAVMRVGNSILLLAAFLEGEKYKWDRLGNVSFPSLFIILVATAALCVWLLRRRR